MPTMHDPAHPGESLRDALAAEGWTVTEAAAKLGCTRQTFSRVLNGRTDISPAMALALERIGWSSAPRVLTYSTPRSGCAVRRSTSEAGGNWIRPGARTCAVSDGWGCSAGTRALGGGSQYASMRRRPVAA